MSPSDCIDGTDELLDDDIEEKDDDDDDGKDKKDWIPLCMVQRKDAKKEVHHQSVPNEVNRNAKKTIIITK